MKNEIGEHTKLLFDRLVQAGWLDNVIDPPNSPIKELRWFWDSENPANNGRSRFLAFYTLYLEFGRLGPVTREDWLCFEGLAESMTAEASDGSNHSD